MDVTSEALLGGYLKNERTASVIFTRENSTGKFYFALTRKVPDESRVMLDGRRLGAAGTQKRFFGKWGSFGGTKGNSSISDLRAAVEEVNEESGAGVCNIDPLLLGRSNDKLNLVKAVDLSHTTLFIFKILDNNIFFDHFPKYSDGGFNDPCIVSGSNGECDFIASMSMQEMLDVQEQEINEYDNNFFLSYFLESFVDHVIPAMNSPEFLKKWVGTSFICIKDTLPRKPGEEVTYYQRTDWKITGLKSEYYW